ncbi:hypothetical protein CPB83DRAFT_848579 [Crepidotus variabilis]|uniref:F-box domain-containing protein n=1 Tax=Crepidotus variabilis TaxID=179855 RepID=A0A9P6EMU8_9AGAR|nr:hypothetical protein CPB83DRAFT_848579 [Crepidotus variabilis]
MDLPPDILDQICFLLDAHALRACIDAAPSLFSTLTERHLYSAINLSPRGPGNTNSPSVTLSRLQLQNLLQEHPHVSSYIRRVCIVIRSEDAVIWLSGSDTQDVDDFNIPELPCLRTLSVDTEEHFVLKWTSIPLTLRLYWEGLVQLPSIEEVSLREIYDFPVGILDVLATSVKQLTLYGGSQTFKMPSPTTSSIIRPVHLMLNHDHVDTIECFKWLYHAPKNISRFSCLRTLHFRSDTRADFILLSQLFPSCSGTLQTLTVDIAPSANTIVASTERIHSEANGLNAVQLDLSSLHKLKKLVIYTDVTVFYCRRQILEPRTVRDLGYLSSSTARIPDIIKSAANGGPSSTLQELCIFMTFRSNGPGTPKPGPFITLANFDFGAIIEPISFMRSQFTQLASTKLAIYSTHQQPYSEQLASLSRNPYMSPVVQKSSWDISLTDDEWNETAVHCTATG